MLHKNPFMSGRLGRSNGRMPGWLSLILVVVGLVAVSVLGTATVNAQDAPNALLDIILPYNSTTILEQSSYNLEVVFTSEIIGPLTLEVTNGLPSGATFSAHSGSRRITGTLSWSPSELQGEQDYVFQFKGTVDMGLAGKASTERKLTIIVRERNTHPQITPVDPITVNEDNAENIDETAKFTVIATDTDKPEQTLTFSSPDLPSGATLNPTTGAFSWSPTEEQGGKDYYLQIIVRDNGSPALHWQEGVKITVNEFNEAPAFNTLTAVRSVYEANSRGNSPTTVTFSVSATDIDEPEQTLTYSAFNLPDGATFNPTSREFNWSPSESQGSTTPYAIEFKVTDSGSPQRSATQIVKITVLDVNEYPTVTLISPKTIYEDNAANINETVSFTVNASDPDLPAQTLTYSANGLPAGAEFNAATGEFSWSPTEEQGRSTPYQAGFNITDNGNPQLTTTLVVSITVNEYNDAPVLTAVAPIKVNEDNTANTQETVSFELSVFDTDLPVQLLKYSASNLPDGATLNQATGVFSWSPTEAQGNQDYFIDFTVTDNGTPQKSATQTIQITVNEVNEKPQITTIDDKTLDEGGLLTFVVEANDPDLPTQMLSYSAENLPNGATFDAASGAFLWQTTEANGDTIHEVTFIVSDGTVTASETVTITVNEVNNAPVLAHIDDVVGQPGEVFIMTISATDSDLPAQTLTYSMDGAMDGMWLDATTGEFSWTITSGETFVPYGVTFTVTDDGEPNKSMSQMVGFTIQEKNFLRNPGFQVAGKTAKQAQNWKGIGLLPSDKRVCKPSSEIIANEDICAFQFSATPAKATNRKLRQQLDTAEFTSGDLIEFSGFYEPKALTKGAKVQLVAKLADGKTKRATVKLSTEVSSHPEILNHFDGTLTLTAAPVSMWLEISTGKSSGKLFLDNLVVKGGSAAPALIPVPAAPDLRGGAAIGMGQ